MSAGDNLLKVVDAGSEAPATPDYRLQEQVGFLLRKAQQRHVSLFAASISDLTPPQFAALVTLGDVGDCSQNQLGQMVAMDAATIKGVIDRLKARGLVALGEHDTDRRRIVVRLTAAGRETVEALLPRAAAITAETLAPLTAREAATLARLLSKIG